jgi:hypothetical protein
MKSAVLISHAEAIDSQESAAVGICHEEQSWAVSEAAVLGGFVMYADPSPANTANT